MSESATTKPKMQKWVVFCWTLMALVGAEVCPDGGGCEKGQTCCSDPVDGYECCPFEQAECCGDHVHCCPAGTICDPAQSSCVNATGSVPWVERVSADQPGLSKSFRMIRTYMGEDNDNVCPDNSRCPPEFSCLRSLTRFGCCPLAQGVPCSDGKHCCPEGHQCSTDSRSCMRQELVATVLCGDGVSECPDQTTCCETSEGKWGCCPMPRAVCCEDELHCCPEGSTCDVQNSKCLSLSTKKEMPMWAKLPARLRAEWENKKAERVTAKAANDGASEKVPAVTKGNTAPPTEKETSVPSTTGARGNDVPCNDTAACPDDYTCCKTKEGDWACCPLPEAVCCEDFIHCCPKGTTCNLPAQSCDQATRSMPLVKKTPTIPRQRVQVGNVTCDSTSSCPDDYTCCKTQEGGWACCPLPEAVCCDDHIHCCPKGMTCNLATQSCDDVRRSVSWSEKVPAFVRQQARAGNVTCDSTSSSPDDYTCCKTKEGGWACCPLPEAVCCDDHEHCCPSGTTCDLASLSCRGVSGSTPMNQKTPAFVMPAPTTAITTTPGQSAGTVQTGEEEDDTEEENNTTEDRKQCDDHTSCPTDTTCCFMASSHKWGCCPLPEAVCCADGNHCCPAHYKCKEDAVSCVKGEVVIPWYTKLPATTTHVQVSDPGSVQGDSLNQCPEHTTCCGFLHGELGCCPLQNAVCCADKQHCCPQGYSCNMASRTCQKLVVMQLDTVPLTPVYLLEHRPRVSPAKHKDVQCDEKTSCRDGETCCRTSASTWGCCPSPTAVCCSDMKHCCPTGYTCTDTGSCTQDSRFHWNDWQVFLSNNKKRALIV